MASSIGSQLALTAFALVVALAGRASAQERPEPTCRACLLVADDGAVLFARAAETPLPNASTTKIATALVVVRHAALAELVTVSPAAAATGGGGLALAPGDVYSVRDLLYAMLLTSSNDAAVALAEHVSGSVGAFVAEMNALARRLGARRAHFSNPHGLDQAGHAVSARALAVLAEALLDEPTLAAIVATPRTVIAGPGGPVELVNRNPMLEAFPGATGVKTGYTGAAGNVLVASAERSGRRLIAVVMGSADAAADAGALLRYGFRVLARTVLLARGAELGSIVVDPAGAVTVAAGRTLRGSARPETVSWRLLAGRVRLPLAPGERVGTVVVEALGEPLGRVPAVAAKALEPAPQGPAARLLVALLAALGTLAKLAGVRS